MNYGSERNIDLHPDHLQPRLEVHTKHRNADATFEKTRVRHHLSSPTFASDDILIMCNACFPLPYAFSSMTQRQVHRRMPPAHASAAPPSVLRGILLHRGARRLLSTRQAPSAYEVIVVLRSCRILRRWGDADAIRRAHRMAGPDQGHGGGRQVLAGASAHGSQSGEECQDTRLMAVGRDGLERSGSMRGSFAQMTLRRQSPIANLAMPPARNA